MAVKGTASLSEPVLQTASISIPGLCAPIIRDRPSIPVATSSVCTLEHLFPNNLAAVVCMLCFTLADACRCLLSLLLATQNCCCHRSAGVPYNQIELTPMIGGNDVVTETFTLADASTISSFALNKSLAGIHFWSFDRDDDCPPGYASPTCNTYGLAGTLGFTNRFLQSLPGW